MKKKKYQCDDCGYYWEIDADNPAPKYCLVCKSSRIHRSASHKRFAKKSRPKIRREFIYR